MIFQKQLFFLFILSSIPIACGHDPFIEDTLDEVKQLRSDCLKGPDSEVLPELAALLRDFEQSPMAESAETQAASGVTDRAYGAFSFSFVTNSSNLTISKSRTIDGLGEKQKLTYRSPVGESIMLNLDTYLSQPSGILFQSANLQLLQEQVDKCTSDICSRTMNLPGTSRCSGNGVEFELRSKYTPYDGDIASWHLSRDRFVKISSKSRRLRIDIVKDGPHFKVKACRNGTCKDEIYENESIANRVDSLSIALTDVPLDTKLYFDLFSYLANVIDKSE